MRDLTRGFLFAALAAFASCTADATSDQEFDAASEEAPVTLASVAGSAPESVEARAGQELFGRIGCNGCHTIGGVGGIVGPNLSAVGARPSRDPSRWPNTESYIRASLQGPEQYVVEGYTPDMPPPDLLGIDETDIDRLVAYLLTLRSE